MSPCKKWFQHLRISNFNIIKHSPLVCSIIIIASSWPFLFLYHDFYLLTYFVCSIEAQRFKPWNLQAQVQSSNKNDVEILIRFITTTIVACFAVCLKCVRVELCAWVSQYIDIDTLIWLSLRVSHSRSARSNFT